MLAALENGVQGGKWYSMLDKVYAPGTLVAAWEQVKRNRGSHGVDGVSIARFESQVERYLLELHEAVKAGSYRPLAVRRVYIPKSGGGQRPLGIPAIKDRVVQAALKLVIEPIFEREFAERSYGFRPGRGCKDALREVDELLKEGRVWVVDADLKSYFDTIPHAPLLHQVGERISDGRVLDLIERYLGQDILDGLERWSPAAGTPQGAVLSPLLANLYLHPLDRQMAEAGYRMVRYADDFVVLCTSEDQARAALEKVRDWVTEAGLTLHPDKTHVGNCLREGGGFEFLGYRFEGGKRGVRKKSLKALKDKVRARTGRSRGDSMSKIVAELNPMLRGWFEYFKHAQGNVFGTLDAFIRRRLRGILCKQNKLTYYFHRSKRIHQRWPNAYFAQLGLFTLKGARLAASQSR
jgi:RNA-directed DNA polymerase